MRASWWKIRLVFKIEKQIGMGVAASSGIRQIGSRALVECHIVCCCFRYSISPLVNSKAAPYSSPPCAWTQTWTWRLTAKCGWVTPRSRPAECSTTRSTWTPRPVPVSRRTALAWSSPPPTRTATANGAHVTPTSWPTPGPARTCPTGTSSR